MLHQCSIFAALSILQRIDQHLARCKSAILFSDIVATAVYISDNARVSLKSRIHKAF